MKLTKIYEDAPPLGKIIIILMACVLAYFIYTFLKKITAPKPGNENILDSTKTELTVLQQAGEVPNYTDTQFNGWADSLHQAMDGQGTDEDAIKDVFHFMKNKADVLKLIKAFGIKDYTDDKLFVWNVKPLNLNEWLTTELDSEEKETYVNSQLKLNNINYTF